jgi:hypothetical protein
MNAPKNNNIENKAQISLIPLDLIIPMIEPAYREGIIKYQRESWRLGFNSTVMYDALMRHLTAWFFKLESFDPETKEKYGIEKHHLGAAMFCLINLYATEMNFPELDDRPLKLLEKYKNEITNNSVFKSSNIKTFTLDELVGSQLKSFLFF